MPAKIPKATLSQTAVAVGVLADKVRLIRVVGLEPDPRTELCRVLNIHRDELPERFEFEPGEKLPDGFGRGFREIIDVQAEPDPTPEAVTNPVAIADEESKDVSAEATDETGDNGFEM
jgi:hypothetical protein